MYFKAKMFAVTVQISQNSRISPRKYTLTAVIWKPITPSLKNQNVEHL